MNSVIIPKRSGLKKRTMVICATVLCLKSDCYLLFFLCISLVQNHALKKNEETQHSARCNALPPGLV